MGWFKNWLTQEAPPAPVIVPGHKCHFRRLTAGWAKTKLIYKCRCGARYGLTHSDTWRLIPPFDPAKSKY